MSEFKREQRYYVVKIRDFNAALEPNNGRPPRISEADFHAFRRVLNACENSRIDRKKRLLNCVVVEDDWRIHDSVWSLVEMEHNWNREESRTTTATPTE